MEQDKIIVTLLVLSILFSAVALVATLSLPSASEKCDMQSAEFVGNNAQVKLVVQPKPGMVEGGAE